MRHRARLHAGVNKLFALTAAGSVQRSRRPGRVRGSGHGKPPGALPLRHAHRTLLPRPSLSQGRSLFVSNGLDISAVFLYQTGTQRRPKLGTPTGHLPDTVRSGGASKLDKPSGTYPVTALRHAIAESPLPSASRPTLRRLVYFFIIATDDRQHCPSLQNPKKFLGALGSFMGIFGNLP